MGVEVVHVGSNESTREQRIVLYKSNRQKQSFGSIPFEQGVIFVELSCHQAPFYNMPAR